MLTDTHFLVKQYILKPKNGLVEREVFYFISQK